MLIKRLVPHPLLSVLLFATWMLLVDRLALGSAVLALFLAIVIPVITAAYWPQRPLVRNIPAFAAYCLLVMWDIVVANIHVARIILFYPNARIRSAFIAVPITLTSPEAITMLAATITLTPGTVTADMSSCGRVLLIHSLHAPDPDAIREEILTRYEARLKRIFA
jgi:multicomponent K+:H+ antiporter subunit E